MDISKTTKETSKSVARERECSSLREDLERKKEIIKGLREKEKVL